MHDYSLAKCKSSFFTKWGLCRILGVKKFRSGNKTPEPFSTTGFCVTFKKYVRTASFLARKNSSQFQQRKSGWAKNLIRSIKVWRWFLSPQRKFLNFCCQNVTLGMLKTFRSQLVAFLPKIVSPPWRSPPPFFFPCTLYSLRDRCFAVISQPKKISLNPCSPANYLEQWENHFQKMPKWDNTGKNLLRVKELIDSHLLLSIWGIFWKDFKLQVLN